MKPLICNAGFKPGNSSSFESSDMIRTLAAPD
jgi:hypothetical protein